MTLREWLHSSAEYGKKLVDSGLEGARSGQEAFAEEEPVAPFLGRSAQKALMPAAIGVCLGVVVTCPKNRKSAGMAFAAALIGGAVGFGAGFAWESRRLTKSAASGALKNIGKVRDEHWLEKNPIDYA